MPRKALRIGVLAFQGSVTEHIAATREAAGKMGIRCDIVRARTAENLRGLSGLVIPGGESTTISKLCAREGMLGPMRAIPALFGTCAGAIMLAKDVRDAEEGQETLGLMGISVIRNAYGTQSDSFEERLETAAGPMDAVFIRAPRIAVAGEGVAIIAWRGDEPVACEEAAAGRYLLATCFHPELSSTAFHERFLRKAVGLP